MPLPVAGHRAHRAEALRAVLDGRRRVMVQHRAVSALRLHRAQLSQALRRGKVGRIHEFQPALLSHRFRAVGTEDHAAAIAHHFQCGEDGVADRAHAGHRSRGERAAVHHARVELVPGIRGEH